MAAFDTLHDASFDGVPFGIEERTVAGGRAFVRRRYPYRPGQAVEDTGREPYRFSLVIPLFEDVDATEYPDRYHQLRAVFDDPDTQGEAEFVDPELGPVNCKVARWSWAQTSDARNGGRFSVELEEVSYDDVLFAITPQPDVRTVASLGAALVDDGLSSLGVSEPVALQAIADSGMPLADDVTGALPLVEGLVFDALLVIDEEASTADDLRVIVDTLSRRLDALSGLGAMQSPDAWSTLRSISNVIASISTLAEEASTNRANVLVYTTTAPLSAWDLAIEVYGDASRAEEIIARNPTRNPLAYPPGYAVLYLSR